MGGTGRRFLRVKLIIPMEVIAFLTIDLGYQTPQLKKTLPSQPRSRNGATSSEHRRRARAGSCVENCDRQELANRHIAVGRRGSLGTEQHVIPSLQSVEVKGGVPRRRAGPRPSSVRATSPELPGGHDDCVVVVYARIGDDFVAVGSPHFNWTIGAFEKHLGQPLAQRQ